jgi:hypothetical protein
MQAEKMKTPILLLLSLFFFVSCENAVVQPTAPKGAPVSREAPSVAKARPPRPRVIRIVQDAGFREPKARQAPSLTARAAVDDGVAFVGTARKAAKISIAKPQPEMQDLASLITWCRQNETEMRHHHPRISAAADSARVPEELRNVSVEGWIHFASTEDDNDYHVIVGTSKNLADAQLMNVEISGLPPRNRGSFRQLNQARHDFDAMFDSLLSQMNQGKYAQLTPTHVQITGSLFYDIDHAAGAVGPTGHRPKSAWEIHPVTNIQGE